MKIINNGRGIHVREVPGLEKLKKLPEEWQAFTNLDLSLPGIGIREIDVILVLEDRLLLVDLKDWKGPISSRDGRWFNGENNNGRSPVAKIAEIARGLSTLLKTFLTSQAKKEKVVNTFITPFIDTAVVLTSARDKSQIVESEVSSVFYIDDFIRIVRNRTQRKQVFGSRAHENYTNDGWSKRLKQFFNVNGNIFKPGVRRYGGFTARVESPTFQHSAGIYTEFDVEEVDTNNSFGLLRRWNFAKADPRFQTEEGRAEIAGRERKVIAWLDDRNPKFSEVLFKPKAEDPERGVAYWEVFERRRRMLRLSEFVKTELTDLTTGERVEIARQILSSLTPFHGLKAAHLDLGAHSLWIERPTTVKVSHLMAASIPDVQSLGESRYQFLSTVRTPEDVLEEPVDPFRKDVFMLGCMVHLLLFGKFPEGDPPEWVASIDTNNTFSDQHEWFEKCLDLDQDQRFSNVDEMLVAFNASFESRVDDKTLIEGLERFRTLKTLRSVFREYPETELIKEDDRTIIWKSDTEQQELLVKVWQTLALGDIAKERSRILAFLDQTQQLVEAPLQGVSKLLNVHWTGDALVIVQQYVQGKTLTSFIEEDSFSDVSEVFNFIVALIDIVENLHARAIGHGDIKPDNIVVQNLEGPQPVLIDLMDFSSEQDGPRQSRAYSPIVGGHFERDRFAITKIVEELLVKVVLPNELVRQIAGSIEECRMGPPANGTLLPLREVIERVQSPSDENELTTYTVSLPQGDVGPIYPDEGVFLVAKTDRRIHIIGAVEELSIELNSDGTPVRAWRDPLEQTKRNWLSHQKICVFCAHIVIKTGSYRLDDISLIFQLPEVAAALTESIPLSIEVEEELEVSQIASIEAKEDDLVSRELLENSISSTLVEVPLLWERFIKVEGDFKTEVIALDDSRYLESLGSHVVPIQLALGSIDFDRSDVVVVERLDTKGGWRKIGRLNVQRSSSEMLVINPYIDTYRGVVIRDSDRLRFQSRLENTSWQRREEATTRILKGNPVAPRLFEAFNPRSALLPNKEPLVVDETMLSSKYYLNSTQIDAFKEILRCRPLGLLQGPPGTGKTHFIGALVHYVLSQGIVRNVLVASQSHEAVNNAAEAVFNLFGTDRDALSMIRVGAEGQVSDSLRHYHVAVVEKAYKDNFVATRNKRISEVARSIGLDQMKCDLVLYFEDTIHPILTRISELAEDESQIDRVNSLKETVEQCLLVKDIVCDLVDLELSDLESMVASLYFSKIAGGQAHLVERLRNIVELGRDLVGTVSTWHRSYETFLAGTRQVVAGTCVGLGRSSLGLTKTPFDLVIVDEAARCTSSELAVPIQAGKWVVLVGDHEQLEPLHSADVVNALTDELGLPVSEIVRSDFERIFQSEYGKEAGHTLKKQYRMLPPIGRLVSNAFYERALQHGRIDPIVPQEVLPAELRVPLVWVCTDSMGVDAYQSKNDTRLGSLQNEAEADVIVSLLKKWSRHELFLDWISSLQDGSQAIGVICAYAAQLDLIRRKLQAESLPEIFRRTIKVDTIDSYQGKENLIVMLSLVRNNADSEKTRGISTINPGFMAKKNRINVALSRARDRLLIVGAKSAWREGSPLNLVAKGFDEEAKAGEALLLDATEIISSLKIETKRKDKSEYFQKKSECIE